MSRFANHRWYQEYRRKVEEETRPRPQVYVPEKPLSPIEDSAESGNVDRVKALYSSSNRIDRDDAMDTAYRGTKVDPPMKGCSKIVKFLASKGHRVPTYDIYGERVN
jgi:hypothetical protein